MSIIFGIRKRGEPCPEESDIRKLGHATDRYAPDGTFISVMARVGMGFQPNHTHQRSRLETQPCVDACGNMLTFDGRLDNHAELRKTLRMAGDDISDSEIVLAAFERWGENCFRRFVGDWALALWANEKRTLFLARDHVGTRTLYYEIAQGHILWGTYLETFFADRPERELDEAYLACFLACHPVGEMTPYRGVHAVPAAHYICIQDESTRVEAHWSWLVTNRIHYRMDAEYEEHFLSLFQQAVERRTGVGAPILAQLSGGMDSSSIVCMSDHIRTQRGAQRQELLDTVSYYHDGEPDWDERPYFQAVEKQRGKVGIHLSLPLLSEEFAPAPVVYRWPGADMATYDNERRLMEATASRNHRVLLSGIGGDELLGGVPTALPELADRLAVGDFTGYLKSTTDWCLTDRTPWLHMTGRTLRFLLQQYLPLWTGKPSLPSWGTQRLAQHLARGERIPAKGFFSLAEPSCIANSRMGPALLETMPHQRPHYFKRYEFRYPYLDRDLIEFLLGVPRQHLVRPGRRRALMRSALQFLVPNEIVERRRKATRSRSLLLALQYQPEKVRAVFKNLPEFATGLVDRRRLEEEGLEAIRKNDLYTMPFLLRAVFLGLWHQHTERTQANDIHVSAC
jgi:asparagine synthase (glutamine-hydrolysing)